MNRRTMKKIIGLCCATFLLSGCHIYKSYDRPESIDATGIYRDPVAANDTLAANDTTNMGILLDPISVMMLVVISSPRLYSPAQPDQK